jgi:hypothetical protein
MRSRPSWRFDPDELGVLATLLRLSQWPFPFSVRSTAAMRDEQRARAHAAAQRLSVGDLLRGDRVEPDLENALLTLARPRWSIDAYGFHGEAPASVVRVLGACSGPAAVVGVQAPGTDEHVGGAIDLRVVVPSEVCAAVVHALPDVRAGGEPEARVPIDQLTARASDSVAWSAQPSATELGRARLARLAAEPFAGAGQVGMTASVEQGPPLRRCPLRWIDRPHDGRYLLAGQGEVAVRPADADVLTTALAAELQLVLARR